MKTKLCDREATSNQEINENKEEQVNQQKKHWKRKRTIKAKDRLKGRGAGIVLFDRDALMDKSNDWPERAPPAELWEQEEASSGRRHLSLADKTRA